MRDIEIKENILFQLDMCWQLYLYHTENLKEIEALWSFSPMGLQIRRQDDGWSIDWPERESYEIGPSSIGTLKKEDITWPGSVEKAKEEIKTLHDKWVEKLINMSDVEYQSQQYAKWPLEGRSFADTALWLNGELMKNVAEIGYGRFLYAACKK